MLTGNKRLGGDADTALAVESLLRRIIEVNSVVLSVLGDDSGRKTDDMYRVVYGDEMEEAHG